MEGLCGFPSRKGTENGEARITRPFGGTVDVLTLTSGRRRAERLLGRCRQRPGDRTSPWGYLSGAVTSSGLKEVAGIPGAVGWEVCRGLDEFGVPVPLDWSTAPKRVWVTAWETLSTTRMKGSHRGWHSASPQEASADVPRGTEGQRVAVG